MTHSLIGSPHLLSDVRAYGSSNGAFRQGVADLWCTYAATRALRWLEARPADIDGCVTYLRNCQTRDGGFAWQRGLTPDIWATYYCAQGLADLKAPVARTSELHAWLATLWTADGGCSMTPGQLPDLWATYFAVRTLAQTLGDRVPEPRRLRDWLREHQRADGGIGWTPASGWSDTRAAYYAVHPAADADVGEVGWLIGPLVRWLRDRQAAVGGFTFSEESTEPCLWATFRAVRALAALGAHPRDPDGCAAWILARQLPGSGFERWAGYAVADVWATFSAVGALATLGRRLPDGLAAAARRFLLTCQVPSSGFVYREPHLAGDSLATAAICIADLLSQRGGVNLSAALRWLRSVQMTNEGGVMYMPARGAEIRSTLWAVVALGLADERLDRRRLAAWLGTLQNPDGGFGLWEGRASDVIATAAAVETAIRGGIDHAVDLARAAAFAARCCGSDGARLAAGGRAVSLSFTCAAARVLRHSASAALVPSLLSTIPACGTRWGGYSSQPGGVPDLSSTYAAITLLADLGLDWDASATASFLRRVRSEDGRYSWSPLADQSGGPLADCYGSLLETAVVARRRGSPVVLPYLPL